MRYLAINMALAVWLVPCFLFAQRLHSATWLVGYNIVDFRVTPPRFITNAIADTASPWYNCNMNDSTGNLLFYVAQTRLRNKYQKPTPNGYLARPNTSWIGFGATNIIFNMVPNPGNKYQYYLFIPEGDGYLEASLIDIRLDSGRGDIVEGFKRMPAIHANPGQAISYLTIMQHANNRDFWLVYRRYIPWRTGTNDTLYAQLLDPNGINPTAVKTKVLRYSNNQGFTMPGQAGSPNSELLFFSAFEDSIVRVPARPTSRLYRFNRQTGQFYDEVTWPYPQFPLGFDNYVDNSAVFSSNSNNVFESIQYREPDSIPNRYRFPQYRMKWPVGYHQADSIVAKGGLLEGVQGTRTGGEDFKLAPDGNVYMLASSVGLFKVECSNLPGLQHNLINVLPGNIGTLGARLPFHNQTFLVNAYKLQAQAERPYACLGDTVRLFAYGAGMNRFRWYNQAGQLVDTSNAMRWFARDSAATFRVVAQGPCGQQDSVTLTVRAVPKPPIPVVQVSRNTLCNGDTAILTAPPGYRHYLWYPWDTSRSIRVRKPGWYRVEVSNGPGCTSVSEPVRIDTIAGENPPNPGISPGDTSICQGQSLNLTAQNTQNFGVRWSTGDTTQTITVTQTGRYEVRLRTPLGCQSDSAAGINVTVNPLPRAQTLASGNNDSTVCFSGQTIPLGIASEPNTRYTWTSSLPGATDSLSNPQLSNPTLRYLNTDSVTSTFHLSLFTFHQPSGCSNSDSLTLTFVPFLRPNAGTDQSHCPGQTANLGLRGFSTFAYRWNPETGLASPNQATTSGSLTNTTQTPISQTYVRTVSLLGCSASDTVNLTSLPQPPGLQISGPQFVCPGVTNVPYQVRGQVSGDRIQVEIQGGDSARFEESVLYVNWGAANPNGQITLIPVNNFGCKGDSTTLAINITRQLRPQTTLILGINDSLCLSNAQNLPYGIVNHNPQSRYSWRTEPPESQQSASQADSVRISYLTPDSFQLILLESDTTPIAQCNGESLYFVRIWPQPQPQQIQGFDSLCIGESKLQVIRIQETGSVNWTGSLGIIEPITPNQSQVNYNASFTPGQDFTPVILTATETSDKGCQGPQNLKTLTIETLPNPQIARIENSLNWQSLDNNSYSAIGRPGSTFTWQVENGQITTGQGTAQITVNWLPDRQPYGLTVTETTLIGCQSQSISQTLAYDKTLFIPNVITPNGDNQNDFFEIKNLSFYPNSSLSIYNRWGKEVFRTDNYQNNWQTDEAGTYFFMLTVEGKVWKGMVTAIK